MIRIVVFVAALFIIYSALKTVVRSALKAYHTDDRQRSRQLMGDEMVLDPECRTYVVKDRAVTRHIRGALIHFCSDACAGRYEDKHRT